VYLIWKLKFTFFVSICEQDKYRNGPAPCDAFLTASARAYQKHVLHVQETVSIFVLHCCDVMALCTASLISNKTHKRVNRLGPTC